MAVSARTVKRTRGILDCDSSRRAEARLHVTEDVGVEFKVGKEYYIDISQAEW